MVVKKYPRVVASSKPLGGERGGKHRVNKRTGYVEIDSYYLDSWLHDKASATPPWGNRLVAGPFVGEFGWELFGWQGRLRYLSQFFRETTVICRKGFSCLYQDFADKCEEFEGDVSGETSGPLLRYFKYRNDIPYHKNNDLRILPQTHLVRYDWDEAEQLSEFKEQSFVKYGKTGEKGWDILFHARSTAKSSSGYRNWHGTAWRTLACLLSQFRIASVGTKDSSDHVPGTEDMRGVSLSELADITRNSGVTVGPSSGPIHFSALCGCPQVTWYGAPWGTANVRRYHDWNPFHVLNVAMYEVEWNPDPCQVAFEVRSVLRK